MDNNRTDLERKRLREEASLRQGPRASKTDQPTNPTRRDAQFRQTHPDTVGIQPSMPPLPPMPHLPPARNNVTSLEGGLPAILHQNPLAQQTGLQPFYLPVQRASEPFSILPLRAAPTAPSFRSTIALPVSNHPTSTAQDLLNTSTSTPNLLPRIGAVGQSENANPVGTRPETTSATAGTLGPLSDNAGTSNGISGELPVTRYKKMTRKTEIRIQADLRLSSKSDQDWREWRQEFVHDTASKHNEQVPSQHPRMFCKERNVGESGNSKNWYFSLDWHSCWWIPRGHPGSHLDSEAFETLVSPNFRPCGAMTTPTWQENIRATWRFLNQNYHLGDSNFPGHGTRIDIDHLPPLDLREQKRVMQGFLYFDPVLVTMMPEGTKCPKIWSRDVPIVPGKGPASQFIRSIENAGDLTAFCEVIMDATAVHHRWATVDIRAFSQERRKWIQFWYAPACKTAAEVIEWTDFALSFVESCLACTSAASLLRLPRNKQGLRTFMTRRGSGYEELYGRDVVLTTMFHTSERTTRKQ